MAKPQIEVDALKSLLGKDFADVSAFRPLVEGEESRAYAFDVGDDRFVVRVNGSAAGFEKDRLAHERFHGPALPVPEVLLLAPTGAGSWYCVSRRLAGDTLQALPMGEALQYGVAMGQLLDALAALELSGARGAGPFDASGETAFARWPDFVGEVGKWDWTALPASPGTDVSRLVDRVCRMAVALPDRRRLVHGDFGSNNVLVQDGAITGLIDWSEAMIGDPLYDIANVFYWRPWLDCMEQQCRFIEQHEPWRIEERDTLTCYQIRVGLGVLHDALKDKDARMTAWALTRCLSIAAAG